MYAVIMAGGAGTRFWPLSRRARPKQLLAIGTERPLLVETVSRLDPLVPLERVYVVAGAAHGEAIRRLLPELPRGQLLLEPCPRNTAPCVGLAAIHVRRRDPQAVMAVLPADHHILDAPAFRAHIAAAAERAATGEIVTLGIRPSRPETGYGYIHYDRAGTVAASNGVSVAPVRRFVEKPPRAVAERYLADGGYLWNSGMFFFTAARILDDIARFLPGLSAALSRIEAALGTPEHDAVLARELAATQSISIDYGVMEHAENVRVIPADIGWNDVGHWAAVADFAESDNHGNVVSGRTVLIDSRGNIVQAGERMVALVGVSDLVVVDTPDALLVCARDRAQDVRRIVDRLREAGEEELL